MRVALVHEFLTQFGGAERVLKAFLEIYPEAPVYTLVYDKDKTGQIFDKYDVRTSYIQNLPGGVRHYKWYLPLMPRAVEHFDLSAYEVVLSDSSSFAKGVKTSGKTRHICYCHTPTRFLWVEMDDYVENLPYPTFLKQAIKLYLRSTLKPWDFDAAQEPEVMVANSETVRDRIKMYYKRDSEVVYPPVDTVFFKPTVSEQGYFLTAARLESYKRIDLVVAAFNQLGLPLKVVGQGTRLGDLKGQAKENIEFLGKVSDKELRDLYSGAKAFVFPALEDAGIMILESLACKTPVIGFGTGGTAEFVKDGETGVLFSEQSVSSIVNAVNKFHTMNFDSKQLRESTLQHDKEKFKTRIRKLVEKL